VRRQLRRLGVEDSDADGTELGEPSSAANPYLFLAKHGMAVAGTGAGGARKLSRMAATAQSNGASSANATSAVANGADSEHDKSTLS